MNHETNMRLWRLSELVDQMAEDEKMAREEARKVLGDWVDGDSNFVPSIVDIVEELVKRCK